MIVDIVIISNSCDPVIQTRVRFAQHCLPHENWLWYEQMEGGPAEFHWLPR
jgi:hypothetical protein